jgi:hypothetical protein
LTLAGQLARLRETNHSPYTTLLNDWTCRQRAAHTRDQQFESTFLQRGVCELSVPDRIRARIAAWYTSSFTVGASLSFLFGRVGTLLGWRSAFVIASFELGRTTGAPVIRAVAGLGIPIELSGTVRGAATHRPDQAASHHGRAVGGASASRNRRFESVPLQRRVRDELGARRPAQPLGHVLEWQHRDRRFVGLASMPPLLVERQ